VWALGGLHVKQVVLLACGASHGWCFVLVHSWLSRLAPLLLLLLLLNVGMLLAAGVGGFGRVYEAMWRGQRVAVKVMPCDNTGQYQVSQQAGSTEMQVQTSRITCSRTLFCEART
jgi:hypothetical protein